MRTVPEWIGKSDNAMPPKAVKLRIIERQNNRCALTGREFAPGDQIHFDHAVPLWLGGKNSEGNLQAVIAEAHVRKTQAEATVRAKINRVKAKHLGVHPKPIGNARLQSRGFPSSRFGKATTSRGRS